MTERDIRALFAALPAPDADEAVPLKLAEEGFVLLVRIAEALEELAKTAYRYATKDDRP